MFYNKGSAKLFSCSLRMLFLSKTKKEQTFITNCGEHKDYPTTFDHSNANPKEKRKDKNEVK